MKGRPITENISIIKKGIDSKLFVEIPINMVDELSWKVGDEIEIERVEQLYDWGESMGISIRNLSMERDGIKHSKG